jgi:hypothetical protein
MIVHSHASNKHHENLYSSNLSEQLPVSLDGPTGHYVLMKANRLNEQTATTLAGVKSLR